MAAATRRSLWKSVRTRWKDTLNKIPLGSSPWLMKCVVGLWRADFRQNGDPNLKLYNFSVLRILAAIVVLLGTTVHAADLNTKLARIMRGRSGTAVVVNVTSEYLPITVLKLPRVIWRVPDRHSNRLRCWRCYSGQVAINGFARLSTQSSRRPA